MYHNVLKNEKTFFSKFQKEKKEILVFIYILFKRSRKIFVAVIEHPARLHVYLETFLSAFSEKEMNLQPSFT